MAGLSNTDRKRIEEAVAAAAAEADVEGAVAASTPAAAALPDPKKFFCKNWPTAKAVLQFLLPFLPASLKALVEKLIRIGDRVHQVIC